MPGAQEKVGREAREVGRGCVDSGKMLGWNPSEMGATGGFDWFPQVRFRSPMRRDHRARKLGSFFNGPGGRD